MVWENKVNLSKEYIYKYRILKNLYIYNPKMFSKNKKYFTEYIKIYVKDDIILIMNVMFLQYTENF